MKHGKTRAHSVCSAGRVVWFEPSGERVFADDPVACATCGATAIVMLPPSLIAKQPDDTTHVCHPGLGGCNHGFSCLPPGNPFAAKARP